MRRAQSLRNHVRPSLTTMTDDLGTLKEQSEETAEETLRRQIIAKDRENDKLQAQILSLQDQLLQRPPLEQIQELQREYKNLELLLQGTQRENERCMVELERGKNREKILERELAKLLGDSWQSCINIPTSSTISHRSTLSSPSLRLGDTSSFFLPQAESTNMSLSADTSTSSIDSSATDRPSTPKAAPTSVNEQMVNATLAQISTIRTLILGLEERMETRETQLNQEVARAEDQVRKFEAMKKEIDSIS